MSIAADLGLCFREVTITQSPKYFIVFFQVRPQLGWQVRQQIGREPSADDVIQVIEIRCCHTSTSGKKIGNALQAFLNTGDSCECPLPTAHLPH